MRKRKKVRRELYNNDYIGLIEDIKDPKKIGRAKVRVESLHGRKGDKNFIPTEDLPWLEPSSRGNNFSISTVGKVVYIAYEEGDYYKGSYFADEHYDINLQDKLESLTDSAYQNFYAMYYDAKHQYFYEDNVGVIFDYMKSNINMRDNGDMRLNLKDNSAKLFLGTEDASQQAMLGNHWIDWFDELVQNLMGSYGGPYLGNMGAPVMPHPKMIEICNKYLAIKQTFLSDHVYIVDDQKVKAQNRKFDKLQFNDNWNTEDMQKVNNTPDKIADPAPRQESGGNPSNDKETVPPSNFSDNLSTSKLPDNATEDDKIRQIKPFTDNSENGKIPVENMTVSKYLQESFSEENDERKYLLDESSKALDSWLDNYKSQKASDWNNVMATKGYQNFERQTNTRKQYPLKAPIAGEDPFGFGNQVELYFGIDKNDADLTQLVKDYLNRGAIDPNATRVAQIEVLDWLIKKGSDFGWKIAGNTVSGDVQWWHWIYVGVITPVENTTKTEEVDVVFRGHGYYFKKETVGPKNRIVAYRESDKSVAATGEYSAFATIETLINEMKLGLNIPLDESSSAVKKSNPSVFKILTSGEISKLSDTDLEARFQQNLLDTDKLNNDINSERITEEEYQKSLDALELEKRQIESEKQSRLDSKLM